MVVTRSPTIFTQSPVEAENTDVPSALCCGATGEAYDLGKRINPEDKRMLNCRQVDVNQLMPLKYEWAWEHYLNGCANHWMPTEVPMQRDIELWRSNALERRRAKSHLAKPRIFLARAKASSATTSYSQSSNTSQTPKRDNTSCARHLKKPYTPTHSTTSSNPWA